ncbi:MAG: poly(3-hydroxybutyrate) depolymerase [Deltaproteobacteria bacterium]|nr:poly(3-hydroxybutyrate) depolymerase [Deltaproteobacteria bacterium]
MADISKSRNHNLDPEVLRQRLHSLAEEMGRKFGIKYRWDGDTCVLSGSALKKGELTMTDSTVSIELTLGMMAKMFKGQVEKEIDSRIDKLLA